MSRLPALFMRAGELFQSDTRAREFLRIDCLAADPHVAWVIDGDGAPAVGAREPNMNELGDAMKFILSLLASASI